MKKTTTTYRVKKVAMVCMIFSYYLFQVTAESSTSSTHVRENKNLEKAFSVGAWISQLMTREQYGSNITVENVVAIPTKNEVLITWNASDIATGRIYYDITSPVHIASGTPWVTASKYANYANSKANIRNLTEGTTYYYKVLLEEASGDKVISEELSFRTKE